MSAIQQQLSEKIDDIFGFNLTNRIDGVNYNFGQYRLNQLYKPLVKYFVEKFSDDLGNIVNNEGQTQADNVVTYFLDFFKLYYFQGDFGYFKNKYSSFTYRVPYSMEYGGKDTEFRWATKDCHYVKTSDVVNTMNVDVPNLELGVNTLKLQLFKKSRANENDAMKFVLDVEVDEKRDEESEEIVGYNIVIYNWDETGAKSSNKKKVLDAIENLGIPRVTVEGVVTEFLEKRGRDFFIHKRLKAFLTGELERYFFQLLKNDTQGRIDILEIQKKIEEIKTKYADDHDVVDFKIGQLYKENSSDLHPSVYQSAYIWTTNFINILADLEDFKKELWNKKRKVLKNEYCISLGKIIEFAGGSDTETVKVLFDEILINEGQFSERSKLIKNTNIDIKIEDIKNELKNRKIDKSEYFVIDTKWFHRASKLYMKFNVWGRYKLYEENCKSDGMFLNSENYQGLLYLKSEYLGRVKSLYTDPPYNTGLDGFPYKDSFAHSSRLSMINDRLGLTKSLLSDDGSSTISINQKEFNNLKRITSEIFAKDEIDLHIKVRHEDRILRNDIRYQEVMEYALISGMDNFNPNRRIIEQDSIDENKDYIYEIEIIGKPELIQIGGFQIEKYCEGDYIEKKHDEGCENFLKRYTIRGSLITQQGSASEFYELNLRSRRGIDGNGCLYKVIGMGLRGDGLGYRLIKQPDSKGGDNGIYFQGKPLNSNKDFSKPYPSYYDLVNEFNSCSDEGGIKFANGKKPIKFIEKILDIIGLGNNDILLDIFGGSGSSAHAIFNKNLYEKDSKTKFIGIELSNNYFHNITLPRLKNVLFSIKWKKGKVQGDKGQKGFFQYIHLNQYEDRFSVGGYLDTLQDQINQVSKLENIDQASQILSPLFALKDKIYNLDDTLSEEKLIQASSMIPEEMKK